MDRKTKMKIYNHTARCLFIASVILAVIVGKWVASIPLALVSIVMFFVSIPLWVSSSWILRGIKKQEKKQNEQSKQ